MVLRVRRVRIRSLAGSTAATAVSPRHGGWTVRSTRRAEE